MPSKRSFFNPTLFRKNLTRTWPLWGGLSLAGAMIPLYGLLSLLNMRSRDIDPEEFGWLLYDAVTVAGPALAAGYAILCAMLVWGYLDNARSVGLMHTLPIDRTGLFVTNALSGMTMLLIPYAVVGGLLCLLALCFGFFTLVPVLNTIAAVILLNLLFFGLATVCAMVTGNIFAMPALYAVVNFAAVGLDALVGAMAGEYLVGVTGGGTVSPVSTALSPLVQIYTSFQFDRHWEWVDGVEVHVTNFQGLWVVAVYGVVGLLLLGLGWLLYRRRPSESAGDVAAFRWMRPVLRFGLAIVSGLTLGWLLYALLWGNLFQDGRFVDPVPMVLCMALAGALGYYIASMLLEKSLRVFHKKSLPGVLVVCALAVLFNVGMCLDVAGLETYIPDQEDVEHVTLYGGVETVSCWQDANADQMPRVMDIHRAIVADLEEIRAWEDQWRSSRSYYDSDDEIHEGRDWQNIFFDYTLKNGSEVRRDYFVPIDFDWEATPAQYDDLLVEFYNDPEILLEKVTPMDRTMELETLSVYSGSLNRNLDSDQSQIVYDAILWDLQNGAYPGYDPRDRVEDKEWYEPDREYVSLEMNFTRRVMLEDGTPAAVESDYRDIRLEPSMTRTLAALVDTGAASQEWVDAWLQGISTEEMPRK